MQTDVPQIDRDQTLFLQAAKLAIQKFRQTVSVCGASHPRSALALHQVALLYKALEKHDQANSLFKKALKIFEDNYGTGIPTYYAALNFLGGQCVVKKEGPCPHAGIEEKASLISLAIDTADFVVSPEIMPQLENGPRRFVQVLLTWGSQMTPELPNLINTNILSMVFREERLEAFSNLIGKKFVKDERKLTLFGLVGILQEWKINTGHIEGISFATPPVVSDNAILPDSSEIILHPGSTQTENVAKPPKREDKRMEYAETQEFFVPVHQPRAKTGNQRNNGYAGSGKTFPGDKSSRAAEELAQLVAEKLSTSNLLDIDTLILPKNRRKFVKKLFRGNDQKFNQFVQRINQIATWKDASEYIEEFYTNAGIYPYDKTALEFSDVIYHRYFPVERNHRSETKF